MYAPQKFNFAKLNKENNSIKNNDDVVMVIAFFTYFPFNINVASDFIYSSSTLLKICSG